MLIDGCKHELEITVPVDEIDHETDRVVSEIQKKVKLPGFRPGKVPTNLIRTRFAEKVKQDVLEKLIPDHLQKRIEQEDLKVVSRPNVSEVHFEKGEPLRFKAQLEVAPEIELGEYRGVTIHYSEPEVSDGDIDGRLAALQEQKAQYVTIDPRPAEDGDYCMVSLDSIGGVEQPVHQDDMMLHVADPDTMPAFTEALRGMSPDDEKEFEIAYPEDYGQEKLAGKTVKFRMKLKTIRKKDAPDLNDEFAKDLGDFNTLDELREAVRKNIFREREHAAQQRAKDELVGELVKTHEFPVPEVYLDRQIESAFQSQMAQWKANGVDVSKIKVDWEKLKESQRPKAVRDVKASLLLDKIGEREAIHATQDEVDREIQQIARQEREPVAAMRKKLEKNNAIGRIANHIRTEKTLNFLFENARKVAGEPEPAPTDEPEAGADAE
jgi:trigger factor